MTKKDETTNFEESIKNYGNKIEHIDSFVEAIRRFPGKPYTARLSRNRLKIIPFYCWKLS